MKNVKRQYSNIKEMKSALGKQEILENIKQAFKEVKLIKEAKLKARPIKELLDEL